MVPLNPQITNAGLALFPNPTGSGFHVTLTHIAIGTAKYDPSGAETALAAEVARFPIIAGGIVPAAPNQVQIGANITDMDPSGRSANDQWIGEIGFYAGSTLFAVWSRPNKALFYKTSDFDVPVAYRLDVSRLPQKSVTVAVDVGYAGMQSIMFRHELHPDPHQQYLTTARADALFLTPAEADALFLTPAEADAMFLTPAEGDAMFLTPAEGNAAYIARGGGTGQNNDQFRIGRSTANLSKLRAEIAGTDYGNIAFEDWVLTQINTSSAGKERKFDAGTRMLFQQSTAPVGYTKDTTNNDKALRIVSGNASSGGSLGFSAVFAPRSVDATTLSIAQIPAHNHDAVRQGISLVDYDDGNGAVVGEGKTSLTGGGESHAHGFNMAVAYVDFIIATKDA